MVSSFETSGVHLFLDHTLTCSSPDLPKEVAPISRFISPTAPLAARKLRLATIFGAILCLWQPHVGCSFWPSKRQSRPCRRKTPSEISDPHFLWQKSGRKWRPNMTWEYTADVSLLDTPSYGHFFAVFGQEEKIKETTLRTPSNTRFMRLSHRWGFYSFVYLPLLPQYLVLVHPQIGQMRIMCVCEHFRKLGANRDINSTNFCRQWVCVFPLMTGR